jgi:hypothetical protein
MPLPRPASPRVVWNDLRAFWKDRPRHQWMVAVLAVLIPLGIIVAFFIDSSQGLTPRQEIVYFHSWPADRTDAEIRAQQKADLERINAARERRRQEFQRLDSSLNRLGI